MNKNRVLGLDIIRSLAILFVLSVHFFGFIPFHGTPMIGENMALQLFMRQLFFLCIPLFLLLTGYLNSKKTISKKYYTGIKNFLIIYVFYSVITLLFRIYYQNEIITFKDSIISIVNYTANTRAWYVNMYIGLFLFIPFLNVLYNNLKDKKEKLLLIATMCLLTSLPGFINQIAFISNIRLMILPDWWMGIYPITYYFVGAYLYEFQPKIKKLFNFIALIIVLVSQAGLYYIECRGGVLEYTFKVSYNGTFLSLIAAILLFTLIYDINIKNKVARFFITDFSLLSFEIYLASYISDYFIYPYFTGRYFITEQQFLKYYLIIVPLSFLMSYSIAFLRRLLINKTLRRVRKFNQ